MLHAFPDLQCKITLCLLPCALCLLKGVNAGAQAAAFMLECLPFLARTFDEFTPWHDCDPVYGRPSLRAVGSTSRKPGVLGRRLLRRKVQVRFGTNPALPRDGFPGARPPRLSPAFGGTMAGGHAHLHGLATSIHETSGLDQYRNITY